MEDIIIEEMNYKALALTLANLFMLVASIAVTIFGVIEQRSGYRKLGIFALSLFAIGFFASILQSTKIKRLITITMDGFIDSSSLGGVGFISYDDIKELRIVTINNKEVIAVIPKNMDIFLSKLSLVKRRQVRRNLYLNLPPVAIPVHMAKDMEPEDILSLLQKRLMDYSSLYA
ncbi:MAG: hypothetical protein K0S76_1964 [Herbinix sp.]|jgi:hypothetical protein|nr:hypothetical protein [Herbinix sp.]